jgi:hypothetical protein
MTSKHIQSEIINLRDLLLHSGIARFANAVVFQKVGKTTRVPLPPSHNGSPISRIAFASIAEYCAHFSSGAYTVVLFDGALIQLSIDLNHQQIVGYRFCYYACPFDIDVKDLLSLPLLDLIQLHQEGGMDLLRLRSPLRFEYDPNNADEGHPVSHVHLLWAHSRCSVVAPISIGHFVKFVFSHFYPAIWSEFDFLRKWPTHLEDRTITVSEEEILHFSLRR